MAAQFDLRGKVAVITGASSGIGRAAAIALARGGAAVVLNYLSNESGAAEAVTEIQAMRRNALSVRADVTRLGDVSQLVLNSLEYFGRIDILVNNAGSLIQRAPIEECSEALWDAVLAVNLKSVFLCSQAVIPHLKRQQGGRIINVSSLAAETGGLGGALHYAAAKGAVNTFTKGLAKELAGYRITVNAVAPGIINTPFLEKFTSPDSLQKVIGETPLGRAGTPEEVAELIAYLASDEAGFITGEVFAIDGGR
ncbi:MAG TPA: 3-oxoacyl-ACP reductase family protein [Blastocatellia bacterium]|nr:3-oxoacyl-ACP reductase family protein [Blastocatellia bacterium]